MLSNWLDLISIFVCRHVLIGLENLVVTAGVGLFLLRCMSLLDVGHLLSQSRLISLRQFVLMIALAKGAAYTLAGSSFEGYSSQRLVCGAQIPDLLSGFGMPSVPESSPLHPTHATSLVAAVLLGYAAFRFVVRVYGMKISVAHSIFLRLPLDAAVQAKLDTIVQECAIAAKKPRLARTPIYVVPALPPTPGSAGKPNRPILELPVVVGFWHPRIVIDTWWASLLFTDQDQLRAVIAHEIAHIRRGHHRLRWLMLWLRDVAVLTGMGSAIADEIVACGEFQADTDSAHTLPNVKSLASAIQSALRQDEAGPEQNSITSAQSNPPIPAARVPESGHIASSYAVPVASENASLLTGLRRTSQSVMSLQQRRMQLLLRRAMKLAQSTSASHSEAPRWQKALELGACLVSVTAVTLFSLLLLVVVAVRVYVHPA